MGQLIGNLTNPAVVSPNGQAQPYSSAPQAGMALARQAAQTAQPSTASVGGDLSNPGAVSFDNPQPAQPKIVRPPFLQAADTGPGGTPNALSPGLSKMGKLAVILMGGAQGALAGRAAQEQTIAETGGRRAGGIGTGFQAGYQLPFLRASQQQQVQRGGLENQLLQNQVQYAPGLNFLKMMQGQSEIGKNQSEAQKNTAEAQAVPTKQALEQAQTEAANYKDDPNLGLIDLRTKQPVTTGGMAPLSPEEAAILGKQPGDTVPLKLKNTANEMVNRGIRTVQANGRSLLVDGKGNTIKDMGASSAVTTFNLQNAGATGSGGQPSPIAKGLADGSMKWGDVVSARTPMSVKQEILAEVKGIKPDFNSGDFEVEQAVKRQATSGSVGQQLLAIGTAREHMKLFSQLADALENNNWQLANKLGNAFGMQFGSDKATNFNIASQAFGGEVGKAFDGAGVIGAERAQAQNNFNSAMAKGQFKGAVQTVDKLLAGKQKAAHDWFDKGIQAKPDFGESGQSNQGNRPPLSSFEH